MARSRTLKPEFWTDDVIVELSFAARLWYQGFWNFALCDQGHIDATPKSLKMKIFPADDVDPVGLTDELVKWGRVTRKETPDGRPYMHVGTLSKHTKMDTRWNTRCPYCALEASGTPVSAPPSSDERTETRASSDEHTETRPSKGKESKGREGEESGARKRGTRLPEDFAPSPELLAWAKEKRPAVDADLETERFRNYWHAESGAKATKIDWDKTWQNWILRAAEYAPSRASPNRQPELVPGYLSHRL